MRRRQQRVSDRVFVSFFIPFSTNYPLLKSPEFSLLLSILVVVLRVKKNESKLCTACR